MWRSVLLAGAEGGLLVVFTRVDNLTLGALPDQVSAHPGNILKTMTWRRAEDRRTDETKNLFYKLARKFRLLVFQRLLFFLFLRCQSRDYSFYCWQAVEKDAGKDTE